MGDDSCQEVVGSDPNTGYWIDIFSHCFVAKIVLFVCLFQKTENKRKKPGMAHSKTTADNMLHHLYSKFEKWICNLKSLLFSR